MRKTKIICTLGPATDSEQVLRDLFTLGMNVARLNFSHGTHEDHKKRVDIFKKLRNEMNVASGLLLDTKGPEIRLGLFENGEALLIAGETFTLTTKEIIGNSTISHVRCKPLPQDVSIGNRILIADGLIELRVLSTDETDIRCVVVNGGAISNNKGANVPGVRVNQPFMSDRDREDLLFAIQHDFDFIAASFTRTAGDVKQMKDFLEANGGDNIKIIAKIENREGVENIEEIVQISDGVMVARGDMGVEIPFEELPHIQKHIIKMCVRAGKPVITATQMLESMIKNPRPTRAEITDVANAIYDGTSAIMLSGETSIGKYPTEAVKTMSLIAQETEKDINYIDQFEKTHITISHSVTNAIGHATCATAHSLCASAIIAVTQSGYTARMISKYRPGCPIIAVTIAEKIKNQLAIVWGVYSILTDKKDTPLEIFDQAIERVRIAKMVQEGDLVVITGGIMPNISGTTNTIQVHMVGKVLMKGVSGNKFTRHGILCVLDSPESASANFHTGGIVVLRTVTDEFLPLLKLAGGIITEESTPDSKAVVVGKTLGIPVIVNAVNATKILKSGIVVTVKAEEGIVYCGIR